ncbi:MAG: type II toxin-antitoxin system Phd/YefM family antitoxin [Clostridium sp.]|nr:type II toxin-antitoxin system Phd/YefM family antitoxin [Clostridium sp.]
MSEICHAKREPIFITKNGYGDLVVMSIEVYESMLDTVEMDAAILESENEYTQNGRLHDAKKALASLRRKHFG